MNGTGAELCLMASFGTDSVEFPFFRYQKLNKHLQ